MSGDFTRDDETPQPDTPDPAAPAGSEPDTAHRDSTETDPAYRSAAEADVARRETAAEPPYTGFRPAEFRPATFTPPPAPGASEPGGLPWSGAPEAGGQAAAGEVRRVEAAPAPLESDWPGRPPTGDLPPPAFRSHPTVGSPAPPGDAGPGPWNAPAPSPAVARRDVHTGLPTAWPAPAAAPAYAGHGDPRAQGPSLLARIGEELFAWFKTLFSAAVYATLIVTFGFQVARVEGLSMAPTLEDQDRLIVNKLAYRLNDPQVGDIVMLYYPIEPEKSFVKRVVGEPGDVLRSVNGQVYRNDVPLPDDFIPEEYRDHDTWGPEVVPPGMYFVMGDHRNNSSDSRTWKWVPKKYIIGKVQIRWWPLNHARFF